MNNLVVSIFLLAVSGINKVEILGLFTYLANSENLEKFAMVSSAYNISMMISALCAGGAQQAYYKYYEQLSYRSSMALIYVPMILMTLIICAWCLLFDVASIHLMIVVGGVTVLSQFISNQNILFRRSLIGGFQSLASGLIMIGYLFYFTVSNSPVIVVICGYLIILLLILYTTKTLGKSYSLNKNEGSCNQEAMKIWGVIVPLYASALVTYPVILVTYSWFAEKASGDEVTVFNVCYQWFQVMVFIPVTLAPIIARQFKESERQKEFWMMGIGLLFMLMVALIASEYFYYMYPSLPFEMLHQSIVLMLIASFFSGVATVFGLKILVHGNMWHGLAVNTVWAISFFVFFILLFNATAYGFALTFLISYVIHALFIGASCKVVRI